jgi:ArsR family metal-binding transcriptional regulator
MPLTGIEIYKLLPKPTVENAEWPTCLAFAMQLAAGKADLSACPFVLRRPGSDYLRLPHPRSGRLSSARVTGH